MAELDRTRDQLGHPPIWTSQVRRMAELDRTRDQLGHPPSWTSQVRRMAELERSCCLRSVLTALPFGIRTNLLLFHLDRSHHWNFTIQKPQELVLSTNIRIDRIKRQRLAEHLELPKLYEEFECSSESTSFRKRSFYKIVKTPKSENGPKGPRTRLRAHLRFYTKSSPIVMTVYLLLCRRR